MDLKKLEEKIKYAFRDRKLLEQALSHSSYTYEKSGSALGNERLEFLGDSILGLVIGDILFRKLPDAREGHMTKIRARIVCEASLSAVAAEIGLNDHLRLGRGEFLSGGASRSSNLSNAMEALIAAVYLDGGFEESYRLVSEAFSSLIESAVKGNLIYDHKSRLIELVQSFDPPGTIGFSVLSEEGPVHAKVFTVQALFEEKVIGTGTGSSKKDAEQEASLRGIDTLASRKV